jgi:undecaprenyl-diphosphatase
MNVGYFEAFWLALVQGLTEFLPISSSGHLVLVPRLLGWPDQGVVFDVAVHVGSLAAVVLYFRRDLAALLRAVPGLFRLRENADTRLLFNVLLATFPVIAVGFTLEDWIGANLRSPLVIASTMSGFALLLWYADRCGSRELELGSMHWRHAMLIGLAQVLALIPGTSRSGITITAALLVGMSRVDSARFSFLLSIPTIVAAGSLESLYIFTHPDEVRWGVFALGTGVAFFSAYACIALFLRLVERIGMLPFVIYRLLLGAVMFLLFL